MFETLLSYGEDSKKSQLTSALFYKDTAGCDVYVGGKVRVLELMRFFYLKHSGSKINFVL